MDRENLFLNIGAAKTNMREIKTFRSNLKRSLQKWPKGQGNKAKVIFQTGSTGCFLSHNPVHPVMLSRIKEPQMHADGRRYVIPVSIVEANS